MTSYESKYMGAFLQRNICDADGLDAACGFSGAHAQAKFATLARTWLGRKPSQRNETGLTSVEVARRAPPSSRHAAAAATARRP